MIYRDPMCVFVGKDGPTANLIVGLLRGVGYPAQVMNEATWRWMVLSSSPAPV